MELFVKNMVSSSCKILVKRELERLGINKFIIRSGIIELEEQVSKRQLKIITHHLCVWGLQLVDDKKSILIEKIKNVIIEVIHYSNEPLKVNYSRYISEKLNYNYAYLAEVFSEVKGVTIHEFIIGHKIERVKELLHDDELSLNQIASKMRYSSAAHLSNQFKRITGLTPSLYKLKNRQKRSCLENL